MKSKKTIVNEINIKVFIDGTIVNLDKNIILKHSNENYPRVAINNKKYFVHVIVQETFSERKKKSGEVVDHIDRNRKNCHYDNLRFATLKENSLNRSKTKNNTSSKYIGVTYSKEKKKFCAKIGGIEKGKRKFLGYFKYEEDAAQAYNEAAIKFFGKEFSSLNVISKNKNSNSNLTSKEIKLEKDEILKEIKVNNKTIEVSNLGKVKIGNKLKLGTLNKSGYRVVSINRKQYRVHRLIAKAFLGFNLSSKNQIDHINCKRSDNRVENLRSVTNSQNAHNKLKRKGLSSNYLGVYKTKSKNKPWRAMIQKNGVKTHIGIFKTEIEASRAYRKEQEKVLRKAA